MGMTPATKQQLLFEIEHLSNAYLIELQNFIQYLKFKQSSTGSISHEEQVRVPEHDPILRAIGSIDAAPFSETIDDTLYPTL